MPLADEPCPTPQKSDTPLTPEQIAPLRDQLPAWTVVDLHDIERAYSFPDFKTALAFVNAVGAIAEDHGHHPDIELGWGRVALRFTTHDIDGLHRADFILAAKADRTYEETSR